MKRLLRRSRTSTPNPLREKINQLGRVLGLKTMVEIKGLVRTKRLSSNQKK